MIELLLEAERALSMGMVDQADRLYRQAADADPRNSIAVVGLARVALERDDDVLAWREAKRALAIDPENAAAQRLAERLEEVWRHQGVAAPAAEDAGRSTIIEPTASHPASDPDVQPALPPAADPADGARAPRSTVVEPPAGVPHADSHPAGSPVPPAPTTQAKPPAPMPNRSAIDRLLRRNRA